MSGSKTIGVEMKVAESEVSPEMNWKERLAEESRVRGWLFSVVAGWCAVIGIMCVVAGLAAGAKWLWGEGASAEAVVRAVVFGALILGSTAWMWYLNPWGRNVAIVSAGAVSWVLGEALSRKTGIGAEAQMMTIVFAAVSISCFTSPHGRALFRKEEEEEEA